MAHLSGINSFSLERAELSVRAKGGLKGAMGLAGVGAWAVVRPGQGLGPDHAPRSHEYAVRNVRMLASPSAPHLHILHAAVLPRGGHQGVVCQSGNLWHVAVYRGSSVDRSDRFNRGSSLKCSNGVAHSDSHVNRGSSLDPGSSVDHGSRLNLGSSVDCSSGVDHGSCVSRASSGDHGSVGSWHSSVHKGSGGDCSNRSSSID